MSWFWPCSGCLGGRKASHVSMRCTSVHVPLEAQALTFPGCRRSFTGCAHAPTHTRCVPCPVRRSLVLLASYPRFSLNTSNFDQVVDPALTPAQDVGIDITGRQRLGATCHACCCGCLVLVLPGQTGSAVGGLVRRHLPPSLLALLQAPFKQGCRCSGLVPRVRMRRPAQNMPTGKRQTAGSTQEMGGQ